MLSNSKRTRSSSISSQIPRRPKKYSKPDGPPEFSNPSDMITFVVGMEDSIETFSIHKGYVCHYSPVLKASWDGPFANAETKIHLLEDISPGAFRLLFMWIYSQKVEVPLAKYLQRDPYIISILDNADFSNWDNEDFAELTQEFYLVQLWITAGELLVPTLQNAAMEALIALQQPHPGQILDRCYHEEWFPYLYEHTASGSPLRNLVVDQNAFAVDWEHVSKTDNYPQEMLFEMVKVFSAGISHGAMDIDSEDDFADSVISGEEEDNEDVKEVEEEARFLEADRTAADRQDDVGAEAEAGVVENDGKGWDSEDSEDENDRLCTKRMRFVRTLREYLVPEDE